MQIPARVISTLFVGVVALACSGAGAAPTFLQERPNPQAEGLEPAQPEPVVAGIVPPPAAAPTESPSPEPTAPETPLAPESSPSPQPAPRTHAVAPGETIHAIAARHGVTAAALVAANGLRGSRPAPGRSLTIPEGDPRASLSGAQGYAAAIVIDRGVTSRRSVALTFDAGADRGYGELILNVLRDYGVRASFGMTGLWARQNPDLVQRMAAEGHRLINHSWDHASFTGLSTGARPLTQAERRSQLDRTEALIVGLTGQSSLPFFRSPYGDLDASVQRDIGSSGYAYNVLWTVDCGGWRGLAARTVADNCLRGARPGAIYLMHVGAAAQDGPALAAIIEGLAAAGYDFETIEEILSE